MPCQEGKESSAMRELFKVLKDHSNSFMQELVTASYQQCFIAEIQNVLEDPDEIDADECGTENVVRVCLVNPAFKASLMKAITKMESAKLTIGRFGLDSTTLQETSEAQSEVAEPGLGDKLTVLINDIAIAMKTLDYALYKGKVYKKCEDAKYTYSYKCDVKAFVNSLAANKSFKSRLIRDMKRVIDLLSDSDCELIRPITLDYNLIEVNQGYCWSIEERKFLKDPIPAEKVGLITPRAFSHYDPFKDPNPKYFTEILENSLSQSQISLFCEDFLRLLKFNQKKHKEKVPCLVGDADSGKTSLFYPILGIIHHSNVATITKQKVFNKAMISKETEVIFVDEASPSTLDVDDWKILTQRGFTACDVKYKTARSFFNRCPMFMTAQQKLKFKPDDQQAMDRRLRYYNFKSLPSPKKKAAQWLRKHPMECIVWAASKARVDSDEEDSSEDDDEEAERDMPNEEGTLLATEKEVLRTVPLTDLLADARKRTQYEELTARDDNEHDDSDENDDESTAALRTSLADTTPGSLRYRHISFLLESRLQRNRERTRLEDLRHEGYQQHLLSRGVSAENVMLLPRDVTEPLPTPIRNDLATYEQRQEKADREERKKIAREVFQSPWLKNTEKELYDCMAILETSLDPGMKASMNALREIIEGKLKEHHKNVGTLGCQEALEQRRNVCMGLGLLRKEDRVMVKSLCEPLPLPSSHQTVQSEEESFERTPKTPSYVPQHDFDPCGPQSPCAITYGPAPDDVAERLPQTGEGIQVGLHDCSISDELLRMHSTRKRRISSSQQQASDRKRTKNKITRYFPSQK